MADAVDRWPSAGLADRVVRNGALEWFLGHGVADVKSRTPIAEFRTGSVTKTMTAVAVTQPWEQGLVDLDAPATNYLQALKLVAAKASLRPVTIRHLTHTGGIGHWRRGSVVLQPGVGSGDHSRRPARLAGPLLPARAPRGDPAAQEMDVQQPGTRGQIVEDVTGEPFDRYLGWIGPKDARRRSSGPSLEPTR